MTFRAPCFPRFLYSPRSSRILGAAILLLGVFAASHSPAAAPTPAPIVLTIGGGPSPPMNQVAIESNVRYVDRVLPKDSPRRVLFADGNSATKSVSFRDAAREITPGEKVFQFLFDEDPDNRPIRLRAPDLPLLSGPARLGAITSEFDRLRGNTDRSLLLYVSGHGSRDRKGDLDNNVFELWSDENLSVRDLAAQLSTLPAQQPVVAVMVQCFSGAFGNLLFEQGDPAKDIIRRDFAGFFATTQDRVAAGCTPEVNEAEYHDFTGYFFAALSGTDRVGRTVTEPTDYDKNGVVGMNEAFAYALIHEPSIDVPVATSDVFLRRFVPMSDDKEVTEIPFAQVRGWASPAQRAVLDGLSARLKLTGETRLETALAQVRRRFGRRGDDTVDYPSEVAALQQRERQRLIERFPDLAKPRRSPVFRTARKDTIAYLDTLDDRLRPLQNGAEQAAAAEKRGYEDEINGARFLRLVRTAKSVVLENRLRQSKDKTRIAQLDRLQAAEARNPLR